MKAPILSLLLMLSVGSFPEIVSAQIKGVNEGDRIRITAPSISDTTITGQVDSMTQNMIRLAKTGPVNSWMEIPIYAIDQLELNKEVSQTGRGAVIGAGTGAFLIGIITLTSNESCDPDEQWCTVEFTDGEAFLMGAGVGALVGGTIGAIIGSATRDEQWEQVPIEIAGSPISLHIHGQPNRNATGIRLTWSF